MTTPTLETERIILRPLKITDANDIFRNWASDPEVTKYMTYTTHETIETTTQWLKELENNIADENSYNWGFVYKNSNELFGSGGISYEEEHKMFSIGYNIMKKYWNMGLVTEAGRAMLDFVVNELNQTEFFGTHAKENPASGRVMEKLGFIYQKDGEYTCFDGVRVFQSREYLLKVRKETI
ncbi:MAG: GNAT family N-acetyltransferase [Oscillospiraceae bacterium]|nr:GNAT family N-acetyltransferase [Oscillospiraceae bacterium]